jgi:hypothetical protein
MNALECQTGNELTSRFNEKKAMYVPKGTGFVNNHNHDRSSNGEGYGFIGPVKRERAPTPAAPAVCAAASLHPAGATSSPAIPPYTESGASSVVPALDSLVMDAECWFVLGWAEGVGMGALLG